MKYFGILSAIFLILSSSCGKDDDSDNNNNNNNNNDGTPEQEISFTVDGQAYTNNSVDETFIQASVSDFGVYCTLDIIFFKDETLLTGKAYICNDADTNLYDDNDGDSGFQWKPGENADYYGTEVGEDNNHFTIEISNKVQIAGYTPIGGGGGLIPQAFYFAEGTFSGVLYNDNNHLDSVVISNGIFRNLD